MQLLRICVSKKKNCMFFTKGQIHGRTVADGWVKAEMQKLLAIQKCYRPTNRHRVACPLLKMANFTPTDVIYTIDIHIVCHSKKLLFCAKNLCKGCFVNWLPI